VPEDQLPTYAKGQHLRGLDATIVERVSAEMVSASQHRLTCWPSCSDLRAATEALTLSHRRMMTTRGSRS